MAGLAEKTRYIWRIYLDRHILPSLGKRPAEGVSRNDVRQWAGRIAKDTPTVANRSFEVLRRIYNWAADGELIRCANPCARLPKPAPDPRRERVYSDAELRRVLRASAGTEVETLIRLIMFTLLRSGEARAIRLSWFDWEEKVLTVPGPATKSGAEHPVPYALDLEFMLRGIKKDEITPVQRAKQVAVEGTDPALFPAGTKEGYIGSPHRLMQDIGRAAKVPDLRCSRSRGTYGAPRVHAGQRFQVALWVGNEQPRGCNHGVRKRNGALN